jgi:hypothetical protein
MQEADRFTEQIGYFSRAADCLSGVNSNQEAGWVSSVLPRLVRSTIQIVFHSKVREKRWLLFLWRMGTFGLSDNRTTFWDDDDDRGHIWIM